MPKGDTNTQERIEEKVEEKTDTPRLYKVFLLNDDYTTMDFVVHVLEMVFNKPTLEATQIMLHVHHSGRGLCGVYTRDIAETKVETVHHLARQRRFPLRCLMERE
jgi:ATP-dependent Clp protease adaptor protein ClpS